MAYPEAWETSTIEAWETSTIEVCETSTIEAWEVSTIEKVSWIWALFPIGGLP